MLSNFDNIPLLFKYFHLSIFQPFKFIIHYLKKSCYLSFVDYKEYTNKLKNAIENIIFFYNQNNEFTINSTLTIKQKLMKEDLKFIIDFFEKINDPNSHLIW